MGLAKLAEEFWDWRIATLPDSSDDLPRVQRPDGWLPDWSPTAIAERRTVLAELTGRHRELDLSDEPVAVRVDGRLLGSALARVHWELELIRGWERNPEFYIQQSLSPIYVLLLPPPPFDTARAATISALLRHVPLVLEQARQNLAAHASAPFARSAVRLLDEVGGSLEAAMAALVPFLPDEYAAELPAATRVASEAVAAYRDWLTEQLPSLGAAEPVGPESLAYFLHRVALLPYSVRRLREMGRQEWHRAVATEAVLRTRYRDAPAPPLPADAVEHAARQAADERAVREFAEQRGLLSQPDSLRHYRFAPIPPYLAPLSWLGVTDDLTCPTRRDEDAIRYVRDPHPELPYFDHAAAFDSRTAIVHEGVHAQQVAIGWQHDNPARQRFYDSAPNEGIAFHYEELMLQAGLFDDAPASAIFVVNAMRLRALRVEVDIDLALGNLSIEQAADRLAVAVPMDRETAWDEAVFFAGNPGQALSYQIGKLQVQDLLSTAVSELGDGFDLKEFHDRLWREGNVPLALQRWELLGLRDHLDEADRLAG
ncbi:DUF885 family protein [Nocardia iowensis]|uniref:DUF885 domain-containing protein n=1 Tax=Nocardia iowensis TaxID=204891 RepID=A0ABX8RM16_NOCIO|nr:DUF885 family protein [Nocardia iowensis]QXN90663.1 DUF885 domain-containing protein [Nocardia iowensis]